VPKRPAPAHEADVAKPAAKDLIAGGATRPDRRFGTVVFDCDSTLSAIEGIEYLSVDRLPEVEALTRDAMDGRLPLEAVYGKRLELVRPDRPALDRLSSAYIDALTPDTRAVVAALLALGVRVCVISGGLKPAVLAVAIELGIAESDVAAVDLSFDTDGCYAGFDAGSPLARSGGKTDVLREWRSRLPAPIMIVGDGATDAEAREVVDMFVAYAGVVERQGVVAAADHVIRGASMAPVLTLALAGVAPERSEFTELFQKGRALLDRDARPEIPEPRSQSV
jgi:phosphoserine phosphatase